MLTLWGDEENPQPTKKSKPRTPSVVHSAADCLIYGHNWRTIGMSGEKECTGCGIKGYCPGCTSNPPKDAQPFYCTRHTPTHESAV